MNDIAIDCLWCVLQVTLVGLLTAGVYLAVRRHSSQSATGTLLTGLTLPILLSFAVWSPWPCWFGQRSPHTQPVVTEHPVDQSADNVQLTATTDPLLAPMPTETYSPPVRDMTADALPADARPIDARPAPVVSAAHSQIQSVNEWSWQRISMSLAIVLVAAGLMRLTAGWWAVRKLLSGCQTISDRKVLEQCAELRQALQCSRTPQLRESDRLTTAATVGWRRPVILLPGVWRSWSRDELRVILAHELAHVARGHFGAWIVAQCGLSLHVYHPLLHWLAARLRLEQEYEADSLAAEVTGGSTAYLKTLAHLALQQPEPALTWPARAFLAGQGTVVRRIQRLQEQLKFNASWGIAGAVAAGLLLSGAIGAAGLRQPATVTVDVPDFVARIADDVTNSATDETSLETPVLAAVAADAPADRPSPESITISGRVTDPDGNPAAGAMIVLPINDGWGGKRRDVAQGITDREGNYSLNIPTEWIGSPTGFPRIRTIWAYQPGLAIATATIPGPLDSSMPRQSMPRQSIEIELPPEAPAEYRFVDEAGQPLADATVEIEHYKTSGGMSTYVPQEILDRIATRTDSAGNVSFSAVAAGKLHTVEVRTDRHGKQTFRIHPSAGFKAFQLREAHPVSGRIVGDKPEWVAGRHLLLRTQFRQKWMIDRRPEGWAEVVTDENGRFEVPSLALGDLTILQTFDEQLPVRLEVPSAISVPFKGELKLRLVPGVIARGRVVRRDGGQPVAGARIILSTAHNRTAYRGETDETGEYRIRVLPGPVNQFSVAPQNGLVQVDEPEQIEIPASLEDFALPTIEMYGTHTQVGRLIDDEDHPLANHTVWGVSGGKRIGHADSDTEGVFELRLPDGVKIERYGYANSDDEMGQGIVVTEDPLVLQAKPHERR